MWMIYFDNFRIEHIPKEIKKFIGNKNIITNILEHTHMIWKYVDTYFCIRFIGFILNGKSLLDYTNLFCPNEYENSDKIILKYSQQIFK